MTDDESEPVASNWTPYAMGPKPTVGLWPCVSCRAPVEVTQEVVDGLERFNAILIRRGERPIRHVDVMMCRACAKEWHEMESRKAEERSREQAASAPVITPSKRKEFK
jgi:hypothetical protein